MALFRTINLSFWTDTKVVDDYTPEDRYFMLWALTNNYTNIIGCYEVSTKQIARDLGYDPHSNIVDNLIQRFREIHKTIDYDYETKELLVVNWSKFNWNASPKLNSPLYSAITKVKSNKFHDYLANIYNDRDSVKNSEEDTLLIPYRYPTDTTITNTITNTIANTITNKEEKKEEKNNTKDFEKEFEEVWSYYPKKQGKANALKAYIKARKNNTSKETIIDAINNYKKYVDSVEWLNYKNGSTWFNQECWNDDYSINNKTSQNNKSSSGNPFFDLLREEGKM